MNRGDEQSLSDCKEWKQKRRSHLLSLLLILFSQQEAQKLQALNLLFWVKVG